MPQIRGVSGMGNISNISEYNIIKNYVVMWRFRLEAINVNPGAGTYSWTSFEDDVDLVIFDDLYFLFQVNFGPASNTPSFYFNPPYNVPLVTPMSGSPAPYYLNANYITLKQAVLDNIRTRIKNTWSLGRKDKLVVWMSTESKTGDDGTGIEDVSSVTINGVTQPNPSAYEIDDVQWTNHKRVSIWPDFEADLIADVPTCKMGINPSNDATNWDFGIANIENVSLKMGQVSHSYNNIGEYYYAQRGNAITSVVPNNLTFGEFEQVDDLAWFQQSSRQNLFALICSFMTHGGTSFSISPATINNCININNATDFWMFEFANEVMGIRDPAETNIGWIVFKDVPDGADLSRFPENVYGPVVPVSQVNTYNNRYQQITNSSDPQVVKEERYVALLENFFNDNRRIAIGAAFPNLNIQALDGGLDHDAYNQDFIIYGLGNYGNFMTQYNPHNTSIGYARIGAVNQPHGRFCRIPNPEISVSVDTGLIGEASYTVTFDIWYYDESGRSWSLNYFNGATKFAWETVSNAGTNTWVKKTMTIPNFIGGGNLNNDTDWTLLTVSGSGTKFGLVKLTVNALNNNLVPKVGSVSNSLLDICDLLWEPFYTYGAFAIGEIVYSEPFGVTPINQSYFLYANTGTIYNVDVATGTILSVTGAACGAGTQGVYILGNTLASICSGDSIILYTNGAFGVGAVLNYYSNLSPHQYVTSYAYVVNTADGKIYNLDSGTGQVLSDTLLNCSGSGIAGEFRLGNNANTICGLPVTTLYTDGSFAVGKILYTDSILSAAAIGYSYVVTANDLIYSVNSGTAQVIALIGQCSAGVEFVLRLDNTLTTVCAQPTTTVYLVGDFIIGAIIYTNINLLIGSELIGYDYAVLDSTDTIYSIDTLTGEVLAIVGSCTGGVPRSVVLGNFIEDMCGGTPETIYTEETSFGIGSTLYYDISLMTLVQNFDFVRDVITNIVYKLNFNTAVIYDTTGIVCNSGVLGVYKLGNDITTICEADDTMLYTSGAFGIGKTMYEDDDLITILSTPYLYIVDVSTGYIYNMYNSVVISLTSGICGGGIAGQYKVSNAIAEVCLTDDIRTLYTRSPFAVGVFLFTDIDLLEAFIGFTYIVNPANDYIYVINPLTGEILSQTNFACTASLYIPEMDDFAIEVAKYIQERNCSCIDEESQD